LNPDTDCRQETAATTKQRFSRHFPASSTRLLPMLRTLAKPTDATTTTGGVNVLQPHGPAVDIAFEYGIQGGRLFATDSNQSIRGTGNNNSSRIVTVDPMTGAVTPFITNLPTGDHPTEQLAFQDGWMYWSQGSTTNSGVVGRDNAESLLPGGRGARPVIYEARSPRGR
jgi:hypothetical protein